MYSRTSASVILLPSSWPLPESLRHLATVIIIIIIYIFCLSSSWSLPKSVRYSSSVVLFWFRFNQSLSFCSGWASASVILFTLFVASTQISASPSLRYHYFTYSVYFPLGLTPSLCVIYPRLFSYDFVLNCPSVFTWMGLRFCYPFTPLPESLHHLASFVIILHILFTFFLVSPLVCALLILGCSFCFRFNQSLSFCLGGPQLFCYLFTLFLASTQIPSSLSLRLLSSWPLPESLCHLASIIIII